MTNNYFTHTIKFETYTRLMLNNPTGFYKTKKICLNDLLKNCFMCIKVINITTMYM